VKRLARISTGFVLLAAGVAMLALPGPGWLTIALALGLLATEYVWARQLLDHLKRTGRKLRTSPRGRRDAQAARDQSPAPE